MNRCFNNCSFPLLTIPEYEAHDEEKEVGNSCAHADKFSSVWLDSVNETLDVHVRL